MKRISKWLIPGFLRRWDGYLLENQPVIWRTRIHWVLFYAIITIPILFAVGYFYPIPHTAPIVDPIQPIEITNEIYYWIPLFICCIGILYWVYLQYQFPLQRGEPQKVLLTLVVYALGLYIIIAFTATAFRMGTIVQTAYNWMDEKDIEYLKENDFFLYGFMLLEEDSIYQARAHTFFQRRGAIFKDIWRHEDTILQNRYDPQFWDAFCKRLVQKKLIDLSYRSDGSYWSYLSYLPDGSYWSDRVNLLTWLDNLYGLDISYQSYRLYRTSEVPEFYPAFLNLGPDWDRLERLYRFKLSYQSDYSVYYHKTILPRLDKRLLAEYHISPAFDTIELDAEGTLISIFPDHIYQLEDAVRSVQHARLYLREGILGRSLWSLLLFSLLAGVLFAAVPYLSFRWVLWALIGGSIIALLSAKIQSTFITNAYHLNGYAYLALPAFSLLLLTILAFLRQRNDWTLFAFHLLMVGVIGILFFAILGGEEGVVSQYSVLDMEKPVNLAFFGAQAIGLVGLLLMAYLSAQPKSS